MTSFEFIDKAEWSTSILSPELKAALLQSKEEGRSIKITCNGTRPDRMRSAIAAWANKNKLSIRSREIQGCLYVAVRDKQKFQVSDSQFDSQSPKLPPDQNR